MMNTKIKLAALPLMIGAAAGALAGCGPNHTTVKAKASAAGTSANTKQDEKTAQNLARQCWPKNQASLLTHSGRLALADCEKIPPQHKQAFQNCVIVAVEHGNVNTVAGRQSLINQALPKCDTANR
jgi:uncharacterized protein YceK